MWKRLPQCKAWPLSRALDCAVQLASALAYCHDEAFAGYRVLHRDVKPPNIGFKPDGQLVLFDFGLATLWVRGDDVANDDAPRKLTGETGSLRYMAPEVADSQPCTHARLCPHPHARCDARTSRLVPSADVLCLRRRRLRHVAPQTITGRKSSLLRPLFGRWRATAGRLRASRPRSSSAI